MTRGTRTLAAVVTAFAAGVGVDSWLRVYGPPQPVDPSPGTKNGVPPPRELSGPQELISIGTTGGTRLRMPIDGVDVESIKGGFAEPRAGHPHEAVDILSARNTPVHAVEDGTIAKLFVSKAGGNTVYQFDPSQRLCFYYAHLERYAPGLHEGDAVRQGDVIGFVGTSGNAPPSTPHLHFAVFLVGADKRWWHGTAIDPYEVFKDRQ